MSVEQLIEVRKRLNELRQRRNEIERHRRSAVAGLNFVLALSFRQEIDWIDKEMDYLAEQLSKETQGDHK